MSYEGFLYKRPASPNPPSMEYCYCVLVGTTLWDFSSKDDILKGNPPIRDVEIIGVSEWDGKGRMHQYNHGLVFVTLLGTTYHACAATAEELQIWLRAMKLGLHLYFHTSKEEYQDVRVKDKVFKLPQKRKNKTCPVTGKKFSSFDRGEVCISCGQSFVQDFCTKTIPLPQYGKQRAQTVCDDCFVAQKFVMFLKMLNGMLRVGCGELSALKGQMLRGSLHLFAQARINPSKRVFAALELYSQGALAEHEMEELIRVDWMYGEESRIHEVDSFKMSIENKKHDVMTILKVLMDKSDESQDILQFQVVLKCMEKFAEEDLDIIDFFWPQLVHLYYLLLPTTTWTQAMKAELLEDFLLQMCLKSATLAVKLIWALLGYLEDLDLDERSMRLVLLGIEVEAILVGPEAFAGRNPYAENRMFRSLLRPTPCQLTLIIYQLRALHRARLGLEAHFPHFFLAKLCLFDPEILPTESSEKGSISEPDNESSEWQFHQRLYTEGILTEASSDSEEGDDESTAAESVDSSNLESPFKQCPDVEEDNFDIPVEDAVKVVLNELLSQVEAQVVGQEIQRFISETKESQGEHQPGFHDIAPPQGPSRQINIPPDPGSPPEDSEKILTPPTKRPNAQPPRESGCERLGSIDLGRQTSGDFRFLGVSPRLRGTFQDKDLLEENETANTSKNRKKDFGSPSKPAKPADFFKEQIRFIRRLGYIAEKLRFIDPADKDGRKELLVKELKILEESGLTGFLPLCSATEPQCRIVRIPTTEGHVFRTKARAPTLIVFEVVRPAKTEPEEHFGIRKMKSMQPYSQGTPRVTGKEIEELIESQVDQNMEEALCSMDDNEDTNYTPRSLEEAEQFFKESEIEKEKDKEKEKGPVNQIKELATNARKEMIRRGSQDTSAIKKKMIELKDKIPEEGANLKKRMIELGGKIPEGANHLRKEIVGLKDKIPGKLHPNGTHKRRASESSTRNTTLLKGSNHLALRSSNNIGTMEVFQTLKKIDSAGAISSLIKTSDVREEDIERINQSIHSLPATLYQESSAVKNARQLYKEGVISKEELAECLENDIKFQINLERSADLDLQFNVALAFGESWGDKQDRIQRESPMGPLPGWELHSLIVKSNDDLRQEVCMIQLIELCQHIFLEAGIDLWLRPYHIISTSASTGLIETISDAMSLDALKKREGYVSLADHFERTYGPENSVQRVQSLKNYVASLAAYSLVCYMFQIKDRHNGNILLDTDGHIVHIDFGFILGIAPGGYWSIETCPFKLTTEMVDVMGGLKSRWFMEFVVSFTCGFLALQEQADRIASIVEIMSKSSVFPCFEGKDSETIIKNLRDRFRTDLDKEQVVSHCLEIIKNSYNNYGMRQYDNFQWFTNGIMP